VQHLRLRLGVDNMTPTLLITAWLTGIFATAFVYGFVESYLLAKNIEVYNQPKEE